MTWGYGAVKEFKGFLLGSILRNSKVSEIQVSVCVVRSSSGQA